MADEAGIELDGVAMKDVPGGDDEVGKPAAAIMAFGPWR
jgi:hypothetical protein